MEQLVVYCYPKCGTCRKAVKFLEENGVPFTYDDIVIDPPTAQELEAYIEKSGLPERRFFNTSGMKYRELGLKDRLADMSAQEMTQLLASDGMLIKRPLFVLGDTVIPGFKEAEWRRALELPEAK